MHFCQKTEEFQKTYITKLQERLSRDGLSCDEIKEIIENIKIEKISNIPTLEQIENGELW